MAGRDSGDSSQNKKKGGRKAIMSQAAWDKLSRRQQENLGGSRFKSTGGSSGPGQRNNEGSGRSSPGARSGDPELEGR
jgi:hypothetical protein